MGTDKRVAEDDERGWEFFWNFCLKWRMLLQKLLTLYIDH